MPDCECVTCPPTWARQRGKSRRFTEPVTLVAALKREDAAAWRGMVARHRECLEKMTAAADGVIAVTPRDDPGPAGRAALVMFAAELASAVGPDEYRGDLPGLVSACEKAATAATLDAAACSSGFAEMMQALAALVG